MAWRTNMKTPSPNIQKNAPVRKSASKKPTVEVIAQIEKQREDRRKAMRAAKKERMEENRQNEKMGRPGDVDFQRMIKQFRAETAKRIHKHAAAENTKINICIRKRPINKKEVKQRDYDSITCLNPAVVVHDCKLRVDGITKYLDNNEFQFDHAFGDDSTNEEVYKYTARPLIPFVFSDRGRATVFAYGQTGSGKTYTMQGIQENAATEIFRELERYRARGQNLSVNVSFFEIYGGRCQDLLHGRKRLQVREDGNGEVQVIGLEECEADTCEQLHELIAQGNSIRTTHATEMNDQSSRSHGICQISIRNGKKLHGKLSLIDLAGSERGSDTKSHNRQRRMESAEINKSLLALKECIRALDSGGLHVPFRASKLTLVIKDSFVHQRARTVMIAAVSPCASSADHTVNTLRYADRVKEKPTKGFKSKLQDCAEIIDPVDVHLRPEAENSPLKTPVKVSESSKPPTPPKQSYKTPPAAISRPHRESAPSNKYLVKEPSTALNGAGNGKQNFSDDYDDDDDGLLQFPSPSKSSERDSISSQDDIKYLSDSLRRQSGEMLTEDAAHELEELHGAVQSLYDDEEDLLSTHMNSIQENAELLTEEGKLLAKIQGEDVIDYDIDDYITRLDQILSQRRANVELLQSKLNSFRSRLQEEEHASQRISNLPAY